VGQVPTAALDVSTRAHRFTTDQVAAMNPDPAPPHHNILVVDDTIENLRLLATILGDRGYDVRPVTNGRQALLAVERDPPDLILLDINMPEMDGYEVCVRLKQRPAVKDIPVIFLTALSETADKVRAFEAGGVDYITKPFHIEEVLARVKTHLALRRAQVELTRSYQRLGDLERLRDDLVHMVVHDMRTPLMVLLMELSRLKVGAHRLLGVTPVELETCTEAATDLNRMTNDLLDVSRLEAGRLPLERSAADLVRIADDVRATILSLDRERTIEMHAPGPVLVSCDPTLIRRVLENIVANGIKHTPAGSPLRISVTPGDTLVRVSVEDQGPGVPADARERIFEKFGTVTTRNNSYYHSAGLGLAFCKLAIEAHGGTIGVTPAQPRGSVFWFELPV
jgi:signal transduction histidine kinase